MNMLQNLDRNFPYQNRYDLKDDALADSIKRHGVLSPVLICEKDQKQYVISGHKRLKVAEELGLKELPVEKIEKALEPKDFFRLALLSNWGQQRADLDLLHVSTKALGDFAFDEQEYLQDVLPALGLPIQRNLIEEVLKMRALEPPVLEAIHQGTIAYRGAYHLLKLPPEDQILFITQIAAVLKLSASQLQQSVECLYDVMRQKMVGLKEIVQSVPFEQILKHPDWDPRQKTDMFMKLIKSIKNPRLAATEKAFNQEAGRLSGQMPGLKLEAPPFFEEQGYFLKLHVRDSGTLSQLQRVLEEHRTSFNALLDCVL